MIKRLWSKATINKVLIYCELQPVTKAMYQHTGSHNSDFITDLLLRASLSTKIVTEILLLFRTYMHHSSHRYIHAPHTLLRYLAKRLYLLLKSTPF